MRNLKNDRIHWKLPIDIFLFLMDSLLRRNLLTDDRTGQVPKTMRSSFGRKIFCKKCRHYENRPIDK
jgi:hypothetical protein